MLAVVFVDDGDDLFLNPNKRCLFFLDDVIGWLFYTAGKYVRGMTSGRFFWAPDEGFVDD